MPSIALILLAALVATSAAPVQEQEDPASAITGQVKRADEFILYGNHQNNERIKKNDPNEDSTDDVPDKKDVVSEVASQSDPTSSEREESVTDTGDKISNYDEDAAIDAMLAPYTNYNSYDDERDKRDVVSPLTAESMQGDTSVSQQWRETSRKRRDLTDAEIAALLEASPYEGATVEEEPSSPEDLGDLWRQELIDMYGRGEMKEQSSLDKDMVDPQAVLRYLYGELAEEPSYANEIGDDFDDENTSEVEPIFYHGRAGLFVPAKRSFISAVPGVRKRSGGYGDDDDNLAYLEEYAGEIERKRNENERERLYELALALNAANDM